VRAIGEDLEDHLLAVDDGESREFLPVALLGGCQRLVEDDDLRAFGTGHFGKLRRLAAADQEFWSGRAQVDQGAARDGDPEVLDQFGKLGQQFLSVP
jgi:hypothetical protein